MIFRILGQLFCLFLFPLIGQAGELTFEETSIDVLATPEQDVVTADFAFKASGDSPAVIKRLDAPCSCLEAQVSDGGRLTWNTGDAGTIRGIFKIGNFRGTVSKQISIVMADGKRHDLTVVMTMPELVKVVPKTLKWGQGEPAEKKSFDLTISDEADLKILDVTATNKEKFPFQLETIEEGKHYKLWVTPSETEVRGFGLLRIATDSKIKKHQSYQAYVVISKPSLSESARTP